jgi:hypothetical protein
MSKREKQAGGGKWATRIETVGECVFREGRPGNIEPRSDRIARREEGKPGFSFVSFSS